MRKSKRELNLELANYVRDRYDTAHSAKLQSGEYDRLVECYKQLRGDDIAQVIDGETTDDAPRVVLNITRPIVRGVVALMKKPLASVKQKPWLIKPTPLPELTPRVRERVMQNLQSSMVPIIEQTGGDPDMIKKTIENMTSVMMQEEIRKSFTAATKLETKVADQMLEAGWKNAFMTFLRDLATYPLGILKIEAKNKKWKQWNGDQLEVKSKVIRTVVNISPFDFYPAPGASSVEDCEYVIERRRVAASEVAKLAGVSGYDSDAIIEAMQTYPDGHEEPVEGNSPQEGDEDRGTLQFYDLLAFYGSVRGRHLMNMGLEDLDKDAIYEAEVWILKDYCIKAVLNPDTLGQRPFYTASFEEIPNEFYGECPATDIKNMQMAMTATLSSLIRNLALSSGPIGEVVGDRIEDDEDPRDIKPGSLRIVSEDKRHGSKAFSFHTVPSLANELTALLGTFRQYAYQTLGIPEIAFGDSGNLGSVGRTSGGVSMVLNQASNTIYDALENVERRIIEPIVQNFIDYELEYGEDPEIKGDVQMYCVGLSGLIEKETKGEKLQWALQSMAPLMQIIDPKTGKPAISMDAPARLLYQMFKDAGIPTDGIFPDYDLESAIAEDTSKMGVMPSSPIQTANLDGRSPDAAATIQSSNELGG